MRKFKLVREYPGVLINEGEFITDKAGAYFPENGGNGINPKHVENYPEFWEEVKDEFPKIISFRNKCNNVTFNLCENGKYSSTSSSGYFSKEYHLKLDHFEIYQVAVSETEVFTLGDKVEIIMNRPKYSKSTISRFKLEANGCISVRVSEYCSVSLHDIKKAPEVLFVTEDGIEIYEGDLCYLIYLPLTDKSKIEFESRFRKELLPNPSYRLIFATKEAAEKYIDENKPIYSKKQIEDTLINTFIGTSSGIAIFAEIFKRNLGL